MTWWSLRWVSGEAQLSWIFAAVVALLAADVVLPVPSSLVSTAAGAALGFTVGTVASILGMTLCSQLGYTLGRRLGVPIVSRIVSSDALAIASQRLANRAISALVIMRPVPVLAEASVVMAGVLGVNPARFFLTTLLANIGISLAVLRRRRSGARIQLVSRRVRRGDWRAGGRDRRHSTVRPPQSRASLRDAALVRLRRRRRRVT